MDIKRQNLFSIQKDNEELQKNINNIENNNFEIIKKQLEEQQEILNQKDSNLPYISIKKFSNNCKENEELKEFEIINEIQ